MSIRIIGEVWGLDLPTDEAWVLMAYADHADHNGCHIYPGAKLIAWKTGYSLRQVYRVTKALVERGVLVVSAQGGGRGRATEYRIDLDVAPRKPAPHTLNSDSVSGFTETETVTPEAETLTSTTQTVTSEKETLTKEALNSDIAMSPQPLTVNVNRQEPSEPTTPARATPLTGTDPPPNDALATIAEYIRGLWGQPATPLPQVSHDQVDPRIVHIRLPDLIYGQFMGSSARSRQAMVIREAGRHLAGRHVFAFERQPDQEDDP